MHTIFLVSLLILLFGLISEKLYRTIITPPMVFVGVGVAVGTGWLGSFEELDGFESTRLLAELTLVLVLFTDASRILFRELRIDYRLPLRLLSIGLPLTVMLGTAVGLWLLPQLNLGEAAVLAVVLAPTDAALGQAVVSSSIVPARLRQALNVESGLNDGLSLPLVLILLAVAGMEENIGMTGRWVWFTGKQVILGPVAGILVGWAGGALVGFCQRRQWMTESFQQLSALALSFLAFAGAELVEGNGFIAAFAAGLVLGNSAPQVARTLEGFAEAEGQFLSLLTFLCFGAHIVWPLLPDVTYDVVLYAVLSLTFVRMLPVSLALMGTGFGAVSQLFLGWFGPRGLASLLFAFLVMDDDIGGRDTIFLTVTVTVLMSVFAHGVTAWPAARGLAGFCSRQKEPMPELGPAHDLAVRIRFKEE